jgi:hypothetical protein
MNNEEQILEMLRCALVNCDNVARLGMVGVQIVKLQIQEAINNLEGKPHQEASANV